MADDLGTASPVLSDQLPIAVDLDGTFLHVDTLHESLAQLLVRKPWTIVALVVALLRGRAAFKAFVAARAPLDVENMPVNRALLAYLQEEKARGRSVSLFSAADQSIVDRVCTTYPLFDFGLGSDGRRNLGGPAKLQAIRERLGDHFVYAGNARTDLHVWSGSASAIFVGPEGRLKRKLASGSTIDHHAPSHGRGLRTWLKALRVHQWSKNLLVFIPAAMTVPQMTVPVLLEFALGFGALCAAASATYLVNDLLDVSADRRHRHKKQRPMAKGAISLLAGLAASILLFAVALGGAVLLPPLSGVLIVAYLVGSLVYSFFAKKIAILDTIALGALFTVRIAVGAAILRADPPYWLFAFSMFFFTSLAFVKRHAELADRGPDDQMMLLGRGYARVDLPLVIAAGVGSALSSVVVFLIYLGGGQFDRSLFGDPAWLGIVPVALGYWLLRIWMLTLRDQMHEDPVLFALHDKVSYAVAACVGLALLLAW
jgi:4-hydroxybenzoate polyprenyltransferase